MATAIRAAIGAIAGGVTMVGTEAGNTVVAEVATDEWQPFAVCARMAARTVTRTPGRRSFLPAKSARRPTVHPRSSAPSPESAGRVKVRCTPAPVRQGYGVAGPARWAAFPTN